MTNFKRKFTRNLATAANVDNVILELVIVGITEVQNGNLDYMKAVFAPFMTPKTNVLNRRGKILQEYIHAIFGHAIRIKAEDKPQPTGFTVHKVQVFSPVSVRLVPEKRRGDITKIMVHGRELAAEYSNLPCLDYRAESKAPSKPSKLTAKRLENMLANITENEYTAEEVAELFEGIKALTSALAKKTTAIEVEAQEPFALTSNIEGTRQAIAH